MSLKEYLKKKKEGYDKWKDSKDIESFKKQKSKSLQERLDRESLVVEGKKAQEEVKQLKKAQKAKKSIQEAKEMKRGESGFSKHMSSIGSGIERTRKGVSSGFESLSSAAESFPLGQAPSKKDRGSDPFSGGNLFGGGGGIGGDLFGSSSPVPSGESKKKKKKKGKGKGKGKGKTITIHVG